MARRYRPIAPLGREAEIEYLRTFDASLHREAVLKILRVPAEGRPRAEQRLREEYRRFTALRNPHLARAWDYGVLPDGSPYMAREWVEGASLRQVMTRGPMPLEDMCRVLDQLLGLLAFMHARRLLLMDLDPRRLILSRGNLVAVDLGVSEILGTRGDGAISGLLAYLPPEIPGGEVLDARSDLYSLGCLAFELAAGVAPFEGKQGIDLVRAHMEEAPPSLDRSLAGLPESFGRFVQRLLEKDPRRRYADALEALGALGLACPSASRPAEILAPHGHLHASRLIGRERELARVRQEIGALGRGQGRALFIAAPAGLGKSRLLSEVQQLLQAEGIWCGLGHCSERSMAPYAPLVELLEPLLGWEAAAGPGAAGARILRSRFDLPASARDPRLAKYEVFQAITEWLRHLSGQQPLALMVEDVHWADLASAELLDHLVHELRDHPVLVAITYRPDELPSYSPLRQSLNEQLPVVLALDALTPAELGELTAELLGSGAIAGEVLDVVERDAEGNPFFASETLRSLIEEGWLEYRDRRWQLSAPPDRIPAARRIEDTVQRRFSHLSPAGRALARLAAVMGVSFDMAVIEEVSDLAAAARAEALDELVAHQFVEIGGGAPRFLHAHLWHAVYEAIPAEERQRQHLAVACALERREGAAPAVLAHHFSRADEPERGTRYLLDASRLSVAHDGTREAIEYLQQALRLQERHHADDSLLQDQIRERIGRLAWLVNPGLTIAMLEHVLAHGPPGSPRAVELQALLGSAYSFLARLKEATASTESALRHVDASRGAVYASLLVNRGIVLINRGHLDEAERQFRQARAIFRACPSLSASEAWFATYATNNVNMCRALRGEPPEPSLARETEQLIEAYRFPDLQNLYAYVLAAYASLTGRFQAFLGHHDLAMQLNRRMGHPIHNETLHLLNLTLALFERGDREAAEEECQRLSRLTAQSGNQIFATYGEALLGRILAERLPPMAQLPRLERAAHVAREGSYRYQARILAWLAEVHMMADRWGEAEAALLEAYEVSGPGPRRNPYQHLVACRLLARCRRRLGRLQEAREAFDEAFALAHASGNLLQLGHLELEAAELLGPEDAAMHRGLARAYFRRLENPQGLALSEGDAAIEEAASSPEPRLQALEEALRTSQARGVLDERLRAVEATVSRARDEMRQAGRMMIVAEFSQLLASTLLTEDVVTFTLSKMREIARADRAVLRLYDGAGQVLAEHSSREGEDPAAPRALLDRVEREGQAVVVEEPAPAAEAERLLEWRPRSRLALPLLARGRRVGILYAERSPFVPAFSTEDRAVVEALAAYAGIALENARLYGEMERRVRDRTAQLEAANQELEAFSYSVSHDLRAPLRRVDMLSEALLQDFGAALPEEGREYMALMRAESHAMGVLIGDLLKLSRATRAELNVSRVDLSALASEVVEALGRREPDRRVHVSIAEGLTAEADPHLLRVVLDNLLGNAWKFTARRQEAAIAFGARRDHGELTFYVRDNGAGFDPAHAGDLFKPFRRLHRAEDFPGTGIGLATVQRIIARHGGHVGAEGAVGQGATFTFTLPGRKE